MKRWLKRLRGAVGMGLTWAAAWFGFGAILWPFFGPTVVEVALSFAVTGLIGGAIFSLALGIAEGRRRFDEMSLPSFAVLGAVGGLFISLLFVWGFFIFPLLGAGSAAGSLALARRADDRELLEHGADVADIGLTEEEKRELLTG